ncbi:hypothetical protein ACA910_016245 [Epithemia clementina (nom. ined.)]
MLAFGSFGVPIKCKRAVSVDIDPLVFQSYKTSMCFLTCWIVLLAGVPFTFTPWGIVSGLFWVPGGVATVYAIKVAGLAIGIGVGSSFIVLVSFIWGIFVFHEEVRSKAVASLAILCMMAGLYGMSYYSSPESATRMDSPTAATTETEIIMANQTRPFPSGSVAFSELPPCDNNNNSDTENRSGVPPSEGKITTTTTTERTVRTYSDLNTETETLQGDDDDDDGVGDMEDDSYRYELSASSDSNGSPTTTTTPFPQGTIREGPKYVKVCGIRLLERTAGIFAAMIFTGMWGGSILVPMKFCKTPGVDFLISFGIGASIVTLGLWVFRILYNTYHYRSWTKAIHALPSFHLNVMWLPGGLSGLLWSIGNFFSILSVNILGEGVGYPVVQTSILVSGLWGIFYFREIKGTRRISLWLSSSLLTIAGILLLSYEHVKQKPN